MFGHLQPGLSDLLCYLLREVVGGNVIARSVYLTVNIRQSKALLLSLGLAVQTGLGAAAQPDQTDQTTDYCYVMLPDRSPLSQGNTGAAGE